MINIEDKSLCCGCNACVQSCPKSCIVMQEDHEGFWYPVVEKEICIDCGLCEKVCPILNKRKERIPLYVYAAKNVDEKIRMQSSSGGIFTLLAETIIQEGGVVFGARFNDNWEVIHDYTETKEGLTVFRGSKYVQSRIGDSYCQAEQFLKTGRKVLFTGTPCQIAGLNLFLRKEYDNLLTVDFICHGVPSPGVWKSYLDELIALQGNRKNSVLPHSKLIILNSIRDISRIEFRNKRLGWKKFSFALTLSVPDGHGTKNTVLLSSALNRNIFLRGFLKDIYLRSSCYKCSFKKLRSNSDITIADFWGIGTLDKSLDDDKGTSMVLLNTKRGTDLFNCMGGYSATLFDYDKIVHLNKALLYSAKPHPKRNSFFSNDGKTFSQKIESMCAYSLLQRIKLYIENVFIFLLGDIEFENLKKRMRRR